MTPTQSELRTLGFSLFGAAFLAVLLTAGDYGIASDVGNYFYSSLRQLAWAKELGASILAGDPGAALDRSVVFDHWRWYPERIPHPPLSRELSGLSYALLGGPLDPLTAYRVAVMVAFALLVAGCGVFTAWAARSIVAGTAAGLALLTVPALFAHGHLAHTDVFLTVFWFGCAASLFVSTRERKASWLAAAGILFGCAAATKFSGLLLVPVAAVWLLARRRPDIYAFLAFGLIGLVTFFLVNPVLWVDPALGLRDYFEAGLFRSDARVTRISTEYLGSIYDFRPPWHYPFVWTAIVMPLPILAATVAGLTSRRDRPLLRLTGLNVAVLYGALMLPAAPMHDGIRLFLPAFAFWAVLAGVGTGRLSELATARAPERMTSWIPAAVTLLVFALPALRTVQYHPFQLSYFNALVGGVRGAQERGLEVTNLKEVLSREVLADLAVAIEPGTVVDPGFFLEEICFYQAVGWAPREWTAETTLEREDLEEGLALACEGPNSFVYIPLDRPAREPAFVFVLNRRAQWRSIEWALYDFSDRPFYEVAVRGVPLMRVYRVR
jgi:hypothetical protein